MDKKFPTPHLEKLIATLHNEKLPIKDKPRIQAAIERYHQWITDLEKTTEKPESIISEMVNRLNEYRNYIDLEVIFDSEEDFLYRQKGQLKLDNSVIEEFLPHLITPATVPELSGVDFEIGPTPSFSSAYFTSSLDNPKVGGGLTIKTKNQDFAISKSLYLKASHSKKFEVKETLDAATFISYVAAECKTNLDKTMFQEACATAHDTKMAVAGAKYFLLCEWLDMTPVSTASTDIDEIIILRKAKRISSNVRKDFNTSANRKRVRSQYERYVTDNPLQIEMVTRFVRHIRELLANEIPDEKNVLELGYF